MITNPSLHKDFSILQRVLQVPSKQKATKKTSQETMYQVISTIITSLLIDAGVAQAKPFLDAISTFIYDILSELKESKNIYEDLNKLISGLDPTRRNQPFSASRTTVHQQFPKITKNKIDGLLEENYLENMSLNAKKRSLSPETTLCIDMSHEVSKSKFVNNQHSFVRVGGKNTWERGFNYSCIYDATHRQYLGAMHVNKHVTKRSRKGYQPWIRELIQKVQVVQAGGSKVQLIEADRGYFDSELFAASYNGVLNPNGKQGGFVRVLVPRKFSRNKMEKKWKYVLNPKSKQVKAKKMNLSFYSPDKLKKLCRENGLSKKDGLFQVPIIQVVLVDEYGKKKKREFSEIKERARNLDLKLKNARVRLDKLEKALLTYQSQQGIKRHPAKYRTSNYRKVFKDLGEKKRYWACIRQNQAIKRLEIKKKKLLNSISFFYLSMASGEDPERYSSKYLKFAKDYHERWGIENGFRDTKNNFLLTSRSQKSTRRQYLLVLGLILYNHWQQCRRHDMLEKERNRVHNVVPWDSRRPHVRKKMEKYVPTMWTAKCYLRTLWVAGLNLCLKSVLSG